MSGLLNSFVPEFPIPSEPGISFGETVIVSCRLRPDLPGRFRSTDIRKTRCDLRHALDCDFVAVTSRTLPQSARTTYSFELLFTYSLSGTSDLSQSPFPANCGLCRFTSTTPATWLRYENPKSSLRSTLKLPSTVLISCACRIFKNALRLPSSAFPHGAQR